MVITSGDGGQILAEKARDVLRSIRNSRIELETPIVLERSAKNGRQSERQSRAREQWDLEAPSSELGSDDKDIIT